METQKHESTVALPSAEGIDITRLERELASMWGEATGAGEGGGDTKRGVMRACVLNLIVYAPAHEERAAIDALLEEVYERNPGRALVIFADRDAKDAGLEAYVSTRCSLSSKGAKQVCGEQVTIEARGAAVERAASAVESLLVPDVPVFLWWKDIPHYEDRLFERLVETSDRVVIDSAAFDNPHEDILRLASIINEKPDYMSVSDLSWGRLTPWRALIASFWDAKDNGPSLSNLDRVEITYRKVPSKSEQLPAEALLLAGWLVSRLGWHVEPSRMVFDENVGRFHLSTREGRRLRLEFRPSDLHVEGALSLRSVALYSEQSAAEFHVEVKPEGKKLETGTKIGEGGRIVGRVLEFNEQSEGRRLSDELEILRHDRVYEQAVAACAGLLAALNGRGV